MPKATGTFQVTMQPQSAPDQAVGVTLARMSLDKQFEGDLVATGRGEVLTAMTPVQGSAGYVAIERVTGTIAGRTGAFVFQHSSTMDRGVPSQSVTVVPDSGTGGLAGISGSFTIEIRDGRHSYEFDYTLPD